jgi:hypothetical protein
MALLTPYSATKAGAAVTFSSAAGGGDTAACGAGKVLLVRNGDATSKTVTLVTPGTVNSLAITDQATVVTAGTTRAFLLDRDLYGDSDGIASITYSAVTSVTVAVLQV